MVLSLVLVGGVQANAALTVAAATITGSTTLTLVGTTTSAVSLDSGTTGTVNLGTGNNAKTINLGTGTAGNAINVGTDNTTADTITIGSALDTSSLAGIAVTVGSTGTTSALTLQSGTGDITMTTADDFSLNGVAASDYTVGAATTTGTITIGGTAQTGAIAIGDTASSIVTEISIGGGNGVKTAINIGDGTGANGINIGGASSTTTIAGTLNLGSAGVVITQDGDGAITILGAGNGTDEDLTLNLDDTSNTAVLSSSTGVTSLSTGAIAFTNTAGITTTGQLTATGEFNLGAVSTFTDSDTTPDVSGAAYWNTNTTATTITDFDGAGLSDGDMIIVVSKGAITFDVTSSGIIGGTTDIVTASGDVTTFIYDGTDWYVTARMDLSDNLN